MKKWNVLSEYSKRTDIVDLILKNRGFKTKKQKEQFLNPPNIPYYIKKLPIDFKSSLKKSRKLVLDAIKKDTPIVIHGDYDADGICATATLFNAIKQELGYEQVFAFIPNRFDHGYGLTQESIDEVLAQMKNKYGDNDDLLFITVDNGITAVKEVSYLKSLGYRVIVTDHHQKPSKLPKADCILWNDEIVGSSISWLLSKAIGSKNTSSLAFAGIATVTDLQPLLGFNRTIVRKSIEILNTRPPLGIKELFELAGRKADGISTYDLGWVVGPRLNASGRLKDASDSLLLLVENKPKIVKDIAFRLNKINFDRQTKTLEMYKLVSDIDFENLPKIIISRNENYHDGIIGLVAARLTQKYYRPSIVISIDGVLGKGSVRSITGIDIISILREFDDLFVDLGGHPMAAGFTIEESNMNKLEKRLVSYFDENISEDLFERTLDVDVKIPFSLIDIDLVKKLESLKPFGIGNSEPKFLTEKLTVSGLNWVGKESQHLSLRLSGKGETRKAIWFNANDYLQGLNIEFGTKVDAVYRLKKNEFNNKLNVDLLIVDMKLTD